MFHPFIDLENLTNSQLYDKLVDIGDQMKQVRLYGMNDTLLVQLEQMQVSIEFELQERKQKADRNKKPVLSEYDEEIPKSPKDNERGTVFDMETYVQDARNKYKKR